jgi:AcrR family transcriptional regulator
MTGETIPAKGGEGRRRRSDGLRSRAAILDAAARLATVEGIEGVSIARLADEVGMSKSGLFAHFASKEDLQLATIEAAVEVFTRRVTGPADEARDGVERLRSLAEHYLRYVEDGLYPGGCFFASVATELGAQTGPVRDAAVAVVDDFYVRLLAAIEAAQREGAIDPAEDAEQLAYEIDAFLVMANMHFAISRDRTAIQRARTAVDRRIAAAAAAVHADNRL